MIHDLWDGPSSDRYGRESRGHGLQEDNPKSLLSRRKAEDVGIEERFPDLVIRADRTTEDDRSVQVQSPGKLPQSW